MGQLNAQAAVEGVAATQYVKIELFTSCVLVFFKLGAIHVDGTIAVDRIQIGTTQVGVQLDRLSRAWGRASVIIVKERGCQ